MHPLSLAHACVKWEDMPLIFVVDFVAEVGHQYGAKFAALQRHASEPMPHSV